MQNIKNIIFDYGNVIFMIDFTKAQYAFAQLGVKNIEQEFGHKLQNPLFDAFDRGEISSAEFRQGIRLLADNMLLTDQQIDHAWNALLLGVPQGKHEILLQLKEKYRTFLLSNNNSIHYNYCMQHIQEVYQVSSNDIFFEKTYYSHFVGMRKPNRDIFELVLNDSNIIPQETLFIDDSPQHLATANSLGMHTELCTSDKPLEKIIQQLGLL